jgi:hypothetical protein
VVLDHADVPCGYEIQQGPVTASESIGVGKLALLVVGRTYPSGPDHNERIDLASASVGLERIHPPNVTLPTLYPTMISMHDVARIFTVIPFGADVSLLPETIRPWTTP